MNQCQCFVTISHSKHMRSFIAHAYGAYIFCRKRQIRETTIFPCRKMIAQRSNGFHANITRHTLMDTVFLLFRSGGIFVFFSLYIHTYVCCGSEFHVHFASQNIFNVVFKIDCDNSRWIDASSVVSIRTLNIEMVVSTIARLLREYSQEIVKRYGIGCHVFFCFT